MSEFNSEISSEFVRISAAFSDRRQSNLKQFRKKNKRIQNNSAKFAEFSLNYSELL